MSYAVSWSGGKDSMLALDRAVRRGLDVRWLFNLYDAASERVRFHAVRRELIARQAERLGLELVQLSTRPATFEARFLDGLGRLVGLGATGVIFGNIHLADVRAWYEERTTARGLEHEEPLWGEDGPALLAELLERGYRTRLVSVDLTRGRPQWLGCELTVALAEELACRPEVDPCGEHGEYHTFVFDGPLFQAPLELSPGNVRQEGDHAVLDLDERSGASGMTWGAPASGPGPGCGTTATGQP